MIPKILKLWHNTKAILKIDDMPTKSSNNLVTSGGIAEALDNVAKVDTEGVNALLNRYVIVDSDDNAIVDGGSDPVGNAIIIPLDSYFEALSSGVYTQEDKNVIAEELFSLVVANSNNDKVLYTFRDAIATVDFYNGDDSRELQVLVRELANESTSTIRDTIYYGILHTDANGDWVLEMQFGLTSIDVHPLT